MATLHLPPQMRDLTDGAAEIEIEAETVRELFETLEARHPGFRARLLRDGRLSPGIAVSIDHVVTSLGLHAPVAPTSVVHIVAAISGGS